MNSKKEKLINSKISAKSAWIAFGVIAINSNKEKKMV